MNSTPLISSDICVCDLSTRTLTKDSISVNNSMKSFAGTFILINDLDNVGLSLSVLATVAQSLKKL